MKLNLVDRLTEFECFGNNRDQSLSAYRLCREAVVEIERLRDRCSPSKVVIINDVGHYVNEAVFAEIERLRAATQSNEVQS